MTTIPSPPSRPAPQARNHSHRRVVSTLVAVTIGLMPVAACTSADRTGSGSSGAESQPAAPAQRVESDAAQGKAASGGSPQAATPDKPAATDRKIKRSASLTLASDDPSGVAGKVHALATQAGGEVVSEKFSDQGDSGRGDGSRAVPRSGAVVTLRVPPQRLDAVVEQIASLAQVTRREVTSTDITATYADTQGRIATMEASITRVRQLMEKATKISDIVTLERELSRREADYEALHRSQKAMDAAVAYSPVTVTLQHPEAATEQGGFSTGVEQGWRALRISAAGLAVFIGAVLPWVGVLTLLALPFLWRLRRRRATARLRSSPQHQGMPATRADEET